MTLLEEALAIIEKQDFPDDASREKAKQVVKQEFEKQGITE